ncbi:MAG: hypothetical protein GF341_04140 [candidate division Zixibacteria bacterium]|nr:hypothetical protein [candidate division Zixibacteria bacterium]
MTTQAILERNKDVVRRFFNGTHSGQLDVIDETVSPDIVTHGFPGHNPDSLASYRAFFESLGNAFANLESDIDDMTAEEDRVDVRFTVRGTHVGEYLGIPATGRHVDFTGMVQYRLENSKIAETWLFPDNITIMQQLGVLPEPEVV